MNNFDDNLKYSVIFLPENHPDPTSEELLMLAKYEYNERSYIQGGSIMDILEERVSKEECGEICLTVQECLAFEYGVDYGSTDT